MMDENVLEFWGNLLINASRGKKQMGDITSWVQNCMNAFTDPAKSKEMHGFEDFAASIKQFYGLDNFSEQSLEYQNLAKKAADDFQRSFTDCLAAMGMVSYKEHLAIIEKYEKLKEKCAGLEETVVHQRMLLEAKKEEKAGDNLGENLREIFKGQGELFRKMMTDFSKFTPEASKETKNDTDDS